MRARVLLADGDDLTRAGLRLLLTQADDVEVVGEARTSEEVIQLAAQLAPDVVVMDLNERHFDGIDAIRRLKRTRPELHVLVLCDSDDSDLARRAARAGAIGWVIKQAEEADLWAGVRYAMQGDSRVTRRAQRRGPVNRASDGLLSPREHEVLGFMARGWTNRQIATALTITEHTVKVHVDHILNKLSVSDRTQAAVRGIELGYIGTRDGQLSSP